MIWAFILMQQLNVYYFSYIRCYEHADSVYAPNIVGISYKEMIPHFGTTFGTTRTMYHFDTPLGTTPSTTSVDQVDLFGLCGMYNLVSDN